MFVWWWRRCLSVKMNILFIWCMIQTENDEEDPSCSGAHAQLFVNITSLSMHCCCHLATFPPTSLSPYFLSVIIIYFIVFLEQNSDFLVYFPYYFMCYPYFRKFRLLLFSVFCSVLLTTKFRNCFLLMFKSQKKQTKSWFLSFVFFSKIPFSLGFSLFSHLCLF